MPLIPVRWRKKWADERWLHRWSDDKLHWPTPQTSVDNRSSDSMGHWVRRESSLTFDLYCPSFVECILWATCGCSVIAKGDDIDGKCSQTEVQTQAAHPSHHHRLWVQWLANTFWTRQTDFGLAGVECLANGDRERERQRQRVCEQDKNDVKVEQQYFRQQRCRNQDYWQWEQSKMSGEEKKLFTFNTILIIYLYMASCIYFRSKHESITYMASSRIWL